MIANQRRDCLIGRRLVLGTTMPSESTVQRDEMDWMMLSWLFENDLNTFDVRSPGIRSVFGRVRWLREFQ